MKTTFITLLLTLTTLCISHAQIGIGTRFFTGEDTDEMTTSIGHSFVFFSNFRFGAYLYDGEFYFNPKRLNDDYSNGIIWGLSTAIPYFQIDLYKFNQNLIAQRTAGVTEFVEDIEPTHEYKKRVFNYRSKMSNYYITMPLYVIMSSHKWSLGIGTELKYLVGGKFKRKYHINGDKFKEKSAYKNDSDFYDLTRFSSEIGIFITYQFVTIGYSYSLTPVFKNGKGPNIRANGFGVTIHLF